MFKFLKLDFPTSQKTNPTCSNSQESTPTATQSHGESRLGTGPSQTDQRWSQPLAETSSVPGCSCVFCGIRAERTRVVIEHRPRHLEEGIRRQAKEESKPQNTNNLLPEQSMIEVLYPYPSPPARRSTIDSDLPTRRTMYRGISSFGTRNTPSTPTTFIHSPGNALAPTERNTSVRRSPSTRGPHESDIQNFDSYPGVGEGGTSDPPPVYSRFDPALRRFQFPTSQQPAHRRLTDQNAGR